MPSRHVVDSEPRMGRKIAKTMRSVKKEKCKKMHKFIVELDLSLAFFVQRRKLRNEKIRDTEGPRGPNLYKRENQAVIPKKISGINIFIDSTNMSALFYPIHRKFVST